MKTKIINLAGAPGAGKSTTAAGLFNLMKLSGKSVELTTEWVKNAVWEERSSIFEDQLYITAKQNRQLHRLIGKVDYVISDSPLFLGNIYAPDEYYPSYSKFLLEVFNKYDNINFLLKRLKKYQGVGRLQTEEESNKIGDKIRNFMIEENIDFLEVEGNPEAALKIYNSIFHEEIKKCRLCDRELAVEHDIYISQGICNFCSTT